MTGWILLALSTGLLVGLIVGIYIGVWASAKNIAKLVEDGILPMPKFSNDTQTQTFVYGKEGEE
jgi:uncharacterized protein YneF (UPF0154 family)